MKKKFTHLISCCFAILLLSSGTAWGQTPTYIGGPGSGVGGTSAASPGNEGKTPPWNNAYNRDSAYAHYTPGNYPIPSSTRNPNGLIVNGAWAVNNQFGAGESSTINGVQTLNMQQSGSCVTDSVLWPHGHILNTTPNTIHLGSSGASGQNVVINSYDGGGHIEGWIYEWVGTNRATGTTTDCGSAPSNPIISSPGFSSWNVKSRSLVNLGSYLYGNNVNSITRTDSYDGGESACEDATVSHTFNLSAWNTFSPYVTAVASDTTDNSIKLIQRVGVQVRDSVSYVNRGTVKTAGGTSALDLYVRPTTVAVQGNAAFKEIKIEDIGWWYNTYEAQKVLTRDSYIQHHDEKYCLYYNGRTNSGGYDCISGGGSVSNAYSYTKRAVRYGIWSYHEENDVYWLETSGRLGTTKLDAAVQILGTSNVLVEGSIEDATSDIQSATGYEFNASQLTTVQTGGDKTDALLVFPKTNKFELRVGGDFMAMNMIHDETATNPTTTNLFYTAGDFPRAGASKVPQNKANQGVINLYKNSVLGVKGSYDQSKNATILTESNPGSLTDKGMIEVGTATTSSTTATDGGFYVFSGSYFKNLSNLLCFSECEQVNFSSTNAPLLLITNVSDTVRIINENTNCCDMPGSINFKDATSVTMLNNAFSNASITAANTALSTSYTKTDGPIEVHANTGSVNFDVATALTNTTNVNNLAVISDASYIRARNDFSFTSKDATLLMHTNQDDCVHSGIIMDGAVTLTHTGVHSDGKIDYITEYRDILGTTSTYPYYSWTARSIPKYGTSNNTLDSATVVTVRGDICENEVLADGLMNALVAHKGDTLTNFQSVFRAANDSIWMGSLNFTTVDGGLLIQALGSLGDGSVEIGDDNSAVMALTVTGNADIAIQSVQDSVVIGKAGNSGAHTYDASGDEGDLLISGHKGVYIHGGSFETTPLENQDIVIASEYGPVLVDAENKHTQGVTGHYLVYGYDWVDFVENSTVDMALNTTTADYAKVWSPAGWIRNRKDFTYEGGNYVPLTILAEGDTIMGGGTTVSGNGGSVSFDGVVSITQPSTANTGTTQILSVEDNVNIKNDFTYSNMINANQSGQLLIQAGTDIYAADTTMSTPATMANAKLLDFNHFGDGQIIMEAHRNIELWSKLDVDQETRNVGEFTMKAGYKGAGECDRDFTDTTFVREPGYLTDYRGGYAQQCGSIYGNIFFNGDADINYSIVAPASFDTLATVINAYRSIYISNKFDYITNSEIQAENHLINHRYHPMTAGNILMYAETGNVEAIEDKDASGGDAVNITVNSADNNNGDIRIQAGSFLCVANCNNLFDQDHGNILFNKPLNVTNNGSGYTILQAHRDIETQIDAPATFVHASIIGNTLTDSATLLVAGRHIETHATMKFDYDNSAVDGSITLWAGRMDHPEGLDLSVPSDWACTDLLCKATEQGSNLAPRGDNTDYDPSLTLPTQEAEIPSNMSTGGSGNGSILLFDTLVFNYYGDSTILLRAHNGNIENDPYLHRARKGTAGYDGFNNKHEAPIIFNHYGTGVTRMEAIDIKMHDKLAYYVTANATDNKNGQFYMAAYDSILTRNLQYVNPTDTGSVFITTAKYKAAADCDDRSYQCSGDPYAIQQGHIVLGYGADQNRADDELNKNDSIIFDFSGNTHTEGANVIIRAGYEGFTKHKQKGKAKTNLFTTDADRGKGYGGNITFDFMKVDMAQGSGTVGGYMEISTPNGNIWGKDSMYYHGNDGHLLVDAGLGSVEDPHAIRWTGFSCPGGSEKTLNTQVPFTCDVPGEWRTGNIMMKGAYLSFQDGTGNATFRTREGFIDTYDAFTVDSMQGHLLKYAGTNDAKQDNNQWGDVSERDFKYTPIEKSGSVFFGADDNIMMNYGYSNDARAARVDGYLYGGRGQYDISGNAPFALVEQDNPYYWTSYKQGIDAWRAIFNVNEDGYMWYRNAYSSDNNTWPRKLHRMYRGCSDSNGSDCSGFTGVCKTTDNFARPLEFNFAYDGNTTVKSGGIAFVATNYIDMFTAFTYHGGDHNGMAAVPGMTTLHGERVAGYGLYMKSLFTADSVEKRRATCEGCDVKSSFPIGGKEGAKNADLNTTEWTYIGFHDDARIHVNNQKGLIEAPVVEFFGHAQLDAETERGSKTSLIVKADSLIFHDSAIFEGAALELIPYTTGTPRTSDMRYGVINDMGNSTKFYQSYGKAIVMEDRETPVIEFGYQRCNEPNSTPFTAPNHRSREGKEAAPKVGGDIIVAFKHGFSLPIYNSIVANHARISFISDSIDRTPGGEYIDACVRTDLLRIRNKVEFYTDPDQPTYRRGVMKMTSNDQMLSTEEAGIYPRHLHLEPNSELSIPGEDSLVVIATTTVGGFGNLHENVFVKANGILAPGFASLMEGDCQTPYNQGKFTIHNLTMEKDAVFRISISNRNRCYDAANGTWPECTQTDTLVVQDSIFFNETIFVNILPESEMLDPGCYLFMEYGDSLPGAKSPEYVKNLKLAQTRFGDYFFTLDFSERGKVYLCVTTFEIQEVRRYVDIPAVEGVTTTPNVGRYFVYGHQDFSFTAHFSGSTLKVSAVGYYSKTVKDLDATASWVRDNTYLYTIPQVVEPWEVFIGPELASVANDGIHNRKVWAHKNTLYVNVETEDIVSIHNMTGVLHKKTEVFAGLNTFILDRGVYVITLKDGSVHKIVIK